MRELANLGGDGSEAFGINDAGQVVGWSDIPGGHIFHAFVTGPNGEGITDLNSLVNVPTGTVLFTATDINNNGQLIVYGVSETSMVPESEIYALMLAGLGLLGLIMGRKNTSISTSRYSSVPFC